MLSLDNAYSAEELADWDRRVRELAGLLPVEYMAELKMDGLSVALHYGAADGGGSRLLSGLTQGGRADGRGCDLEYSDDQERAVDDWRRGVEQGRAAAGV